MRPSFTSASLVCKAVVKVHSDCARCRATTRDSARQRATTRVVARQRASTRVVARIETVDFIGRTHIARVVARQRATADAEIETGSI